MAMQCVRPCRVPLPAIALALAVASAVAQTKDAKSVGEASLGGGRGSGPLLTREELRSCLIEQDALGQSRDEVARDSRTIDDEKAELARAGTALKDDLDKLDRTNADAVQAHVAKAQAHDQRIDAWNAKLPAFNERVQALQRRQARWKTDCADRRYRENDLILLQMRKQLPAPRN
jgi:hypothetical protein